MSNSRTPPSHRMKVTNAPSDSQTPTKRSPDATKASLGQNREAGGGSTRRTAAACPYLMRNLIRDQP